MPAPPADGPAAPDEPGSVSEIIDWTTTCAIAIVQNRHRAVESCLWLAQVRQLDTILRQDVRVMREALFEQSTNFGGFFTERPARYF